MICPERFWRDGMASKVEVRGCGGDDRSRCCAGDPPATPVSRQRWARVSFAEQICEDPFGRRVAEDTACSPARVEFARGVVRAG